MGFSIVPASYVYLLRTVGGVDEVWLQRRANTGYMDGHWVAGAAGHIELGETAAQAAVRECAEEMSVTVTPSDLTLLTVMQRTDGTDDPREQRVDWFWSARTWQGRPRIVEPDKCSHMAWFLLSELPEPMPAYERRVLHGLASGGLTIATSAGFDAD